jgi:hypothetical protein
MGTMVIVQAIAFTVSVRSSEVKHKNMENDTSDEHH